MTAADLVISTAVDEIRQISDWPDELAVRLLSCPSLKISDWAEERGLRAWTISRGFKKLFGVPPEVFRARVRAQRALKSILSTPTPLAIIATEVGFADQAHMTRSVKQLTGATPQTWRRLQMDSIRTTSPEP
jgi:AraC-like DNA-binding protein